MPDDAIRHCPKHPDERLTPVHDPFPGIFALLPSAGRCASCAAEREAAIATAKPLHEVG